MLSEQTVAELRAVIQPGWDEKTAWRNRWDPKNPPLNQCAVTAVLVKKYFGGQLISTTVGGVPHFLNRMPDGQELDLTRDQFPATAKRGTSTIVRGDLRRSHWFRTRFELLDRRVGRNVAAIAQKTLREPAGMSL